MKGQQLSFQGPFIYKLSVNRRSEGGNHCVHFGVQRQVVI